MARQPTDDHLHSLPDARADAGRAVGASGGGVMTERDDLIDERYEVESDLADMQTELDNLTARIAEIDARIAVLDEYGGRMTIHSLAVILDTAERLGEFGQERVSNRPRFKPPKNVRAVTPRVCATCMFHYMKDGWSECSRPNGPVFDTGDMTCWFTTCDRWADAEPVAL